MITAVDTNVLLDIFLPDERYAEGSVRLLKKAYDEGALIICDVVYAELVPQFENQRALDDALSTANISVSAMDRNVALEAGKKWKEYRESGGTKSRIITDFLIAAHASLKADRFATRDRGFYRSYFKELSILNASSL
jgi:predicted nucleic acid-binding protein